MNSESLIQSQPDIAPLGPGDLIDRAVRFYRSNFWTFVLIAAPPIIVGTLISVGWTYLAREFFYRGNSTDPFGNLAYYIFVWTGRMFIWLTETIATLMVMGGASRNFVRHLLFGEDVTFRATYRDLWARVGSLLAASIVITVIIWIAGSGVFYLGSTVAFILLLIAGFLSAISPIIGGIVGVVISLALVIASVWVFMIIASRFAYVPQCITVEGLSVFNAISRSIVLAKGNVRRFSALFIFSTVAIYSALAILYVPLAWYAWYDGVDVLSFFSDPDLIPAWYEIASQLISQASIILLSPVWMIGLCILYVDERVRHEGYDIELMASRRLGDIPDVPQNYLNPLQPALGHTAAAVPAVQPSPRRTTTTLGLE